MKRFFNAIFALTVLSAAFMFSVNAASPVIDTSTADSGYFSAKCSLKESDKIKVVVEKDGAKYTYDLNNKGVYEQFPLQLGDGEYKLRVLRNVHGTKYVTVETAYANVKLENEFAPFLHSSQFVKYDDKSQAVKTGAEITKNSKDDLEKVEAIYHYVVSAMTYDAQKAGAVKSGYLPDVDKVLEDKKGICFDYAAVMAAMLRSQNIPAKLVTGYVTPSNAFHAWNEVYIKNAGWVKIGEIYFDGKKWTAMDPTFMSEAKADRFAVNALKDIKYSKKYEY